MKDKLVLNNDMEGMCIYLDQVDLIEGVIAPRLLDIEDGDDILMVEISKKLHLPECS